MDGYIISGRLKTGQRFFREINLVNYGKNEGAVQDILDLAHFHLQKGWVDSRINDRVTLDKILFYRIYATELIEDYYE